MQNPSKQNSDKNPFFPVRICLFGGNPHFGAMDRQNNSGPPMRAAIFVM